MSMVVVHDTICALATPWGEGGIGVIRLSGPQSYAVCERLFRPTVQSFSFHSAASHTMHHGHMVLDGAIIDEVLVGIYRAPRSYTAEDVVEINTHGSVVVIKRILDALVQGGARLAEPGEFTKRAFLNGRLDLTQAEAVIDVISSTTERSARAAVQHLEGALSEIVQDLKKRLLSVMAHIEAFIDFPEEEIELFKDPTIAQELAQAGEVCMKLLSTYAQGAVIRNGIHAVLVGKPNVGKSSLLNTLLKRDRAIVSDIPGTTRDTLEELLDIQGILFRIVDTAGITETTDHVERLGIERTKHHYQKGDLILFIVDASTPLDERDRSIIEEIKDKQVIVVVNKADRTAQVTQNDLSALLGNARTYVYTSMVTKQGVAELEDAMVRSVWNAPPSSDEVMITRVRHKQALEKTEKHIQAALALVHEQRSLELLACEVRDAVEELRILIGEVYAQDILNVIFSEFCIGK